MSLPLPHAVSVAAAKANKSTSSKDIYCIRVMEIAKNEK
jgi:hypothetical protein